MDEAAGNPAQDDSPGEAIDQQSTVEGDQLFNLLIQMAEQGAESEVTIFTHGHALSGLMVAKKRFFEVMQASPQVTLSMIGKEAVKMIDQDPIDEDGPIPAHRYVHLVNAQIVAPGQPGLPDEGTLIRLSRAEVIGWAPRRTIAEVLT